MLKSSSPSSENKAPRGLVAQLANHLRALGDRVFARDDQAARAHGWQISQRHGGLTRRYRDPRFDWLSGCPWCHGSGGGQRECTVCQGTGRLCRPVRPSRAGGDGRGQEPFAQAQ